VLYFRLRWFVFTGSYRSTLLIATPTMTRLLVKTRLELTLTGGVSGAGRVV